ALALARSVADGDDEAVARAPVLRGAEGDGARDELTDDEVRHLVYGVERLLARLAHQLFRLGRGRERGRVCGVSEAALRLFEHASKLLVVAALGGDERAQAPGQGEIDAATANLVDEFLLRVGALGELAYEREE